MYEEPKKYALALQTYIQLTMLQNHRHPVTTEFKLMERSLHSARYCFVENLFRRYFFKLEQGTELNKVL